jgi:hypothetical protein
LRSNILSAASTVTASTASVSRDAIRRAGPLYEAAVQALRQRSRRQLEVAAVAAVAVIGLIAGLVTALLPASSNTAGSGTTQLTAAHATNTAAAASGTKPYSMYDSVTPAQIPGNHPIATYATGSYAVSPSQVAGKQVIWIDTNGSAPTKASVLDIEPGNVSPSAAAGWAKARLTNDPHAVVRIYTMLSQWNAAKASIATLPAWMQSHVKWWIADPTGVQHVVPGSDATQWYWGPTYDISTVNPGF